MNIFNVISLLGGLALFLYGMRIMGDGLKQSSSTTLKNAMGKLSNNPFKGFLLGLFVTVIIQSSTATIVLTSGLAGAGIISLHQTLGIIIGANVGTTITGQIIRLLGIGDDSPFLLTLFKPSTLAPIAAVIGIIMIMALKSRKANLIGSIAMGFGILFTGLLNMTTAVAPLSDSPAFTALFENFSKTPILGFLVGAAVAFAIQSSSATIGILQALSMTGKLQFSEIWPIIIGIYIGDCVTTAIVCSIGARADAKRTGLIHILFNIGEIIVIPITVYALYGIGVLKGIWHAPIYPGGIANTHTLFNLLGAAVFLPFSSVFEKLSLRIIKDSEAEIGVERDLEKLDRAFFASPELAFEAAQSLIDKLARYAAENVTAAMKLFDDYDEKALREIQEKEDVIDRLSDGVSDYLLHLTPHVAATRGNFRTGYLIKCVTEFERIGDYADNLSENATELHERGEHFSPVAMGEIGLLTELLEKVTGHAVSAVATQSVEQSKHIEPIEEVLDDLVAQLRENHFTRLAEGSCTLGVGLVFLDALVNIERISDQCSNIGTHTLLVLHDIPDDNPHEYIHQLHSGADPEFNAEFAAMEKEYFDKLALVQSARGLQAGQAGSADLSMSPGL